MQEGHSELLQVAFSLRIKELPKCVYQ